MPECSQLALPRNILRPRPEIRARAPVVARTCRPVCSLSRLQAELREARTHQDQLGLKQETGDSSGLARKHDLPLPPLGSSVQHARDFFSRLFFTSPSARLVGPWA